MFGTTIENLQSIPCPMHPGSVLRMYLGEANLSPRAAARILGVSPGRIYRLLRGQSRISPEMALRLGRMLREPERFWMALQMNYDLWIVAHRSGASPYVGIEPL